MYFYVHIIQQTFKDLISSMSGNILPQSTIASGLGIHLGPLIHFEIIYFDKKGIQNFTALSLEYFSDIPEMDLYHTSSLKV